MIIRESNTHTIVPFALTLAEQAQLRYHSLLELINYPNLGNKSRTPFVDERPQE
jgi:hypothetical protein